MNNELRDNPEGIVLFQLVYVNHIMTKVAKLLNAKGKRKETNSFKKNITF